MAYYLSSGRMSEIVVEVCEEFKIKGLDKRNVSNTLWLGSAPCSSKERWKKERKDYDKRLKEHLNKFALVKKNEQGGGE